MKNLSFIVVLLLICSCNKSNVEFPFTEEQMVGNKMYGELLEYALFDTTKVDFVNALLCDTLKKNENLIFKKIITEIGDSSYFFFQLQEYRPVINDYIGMLYVDINNFDSIYRYSFTSDSRYSTKEFIKVIDYIAELNQSTIEETIKHEKVNNKYIPHFYFVVMADYSDCESGFVEKVMQINRQINALMEECSEQIFKNEKVEIVPSVEITNRFKEIYESRQDYEPILIEDEEILKEILYPKTPSTPSSQ